MQTAVQPRFTDQQGRAHWRALLDEVERRQLLAPSLPATLPRLAALSVLLGLALSIGWISSGFWLTAAVSLGLALLLSQFAFIGHDAGHGAISRDSVLNRIFGQLSMTVVTGLAFDEWIERHRAHHRYCQQEERDPDMAVSLVVSLTDKSRAGKGALGRFLTRHQAWHIWLLTLLFGHSQRHLSQAAVLMQPRRYRLDALMLLVHFGLWFGLPCLLLEVPFTDALLVYLLPLTLLGPHLAAIFWVNHVGMPLIAEPEKFSFFEHQSVTSRTILNPPACDWLFGGLNFQIEHHLFPQVPARRLHAVQPIVRRHFAQCGIDYHGVSWRAAVRAVAAHLRRVARAA